MAYIFDTSALIGAWARNYPPDLFPALWSNIDSLASAGNLFIPEEVYSELEPQDDGLYAWVKERSDYMVRPTTRAVMLGARDILSDYPYLTKTGTGRGKADPFVIAMAMLFNVPVVTQEQGGTEDKPRIPYVCRRLDVECMTLLDVIRAETWTF